MKRMRFKSINCARGHRIPAGVLHNSVYSFLVTLFVFFIFGRNCLRPSVPSPSIDPQHLVLKLASRSFSIRSSPSAHREVSANHVATTTTNNNNNVSRSSSKHVKLQLMCSEDGLASSPWNMASRELSSCNNIHYSSSVETVTQAVYLLLLVTHLTGCLESCILYARTCWSPLQSGLITLELSSDVLTLIVFLLVYGLCYHQLWLSSSAKVEANLSFHHRPRRFDESRLVYHNLLNSIAFVYFVVSSVVCLAKLIMIVAIISAGNIWMFHLLKPYVLACVFIFQCFFASKHLNHLVKINSKSIKHYALSPKLNLIKYRREWCNFLSKMTFFWFIPVLTLGYRNKLDHSDLGTLPENESATFQYERFRQHYDTTDMAKYPKSFLWRVVVKTYRRTLLLGAGIKVLSDLFSLVAPLSLGCILDYISNYQSDQAERWSNSSLYVLGDDSSLMMQLSVREFFHNGFVVAIIVLIATLLQSTFSNNFNHLVLSEGVHLKTALNCAIYHKALRMPYSNSAALDMGVISNYIATDSSNIFQFFTMKHYLWAVPIKLVILLFLLHRQMGMSAIYGAMVFFATLPIQYVLTRKTSNIQKALLDVSDRRASKTSELFMGIKLLKLLGWDLHFAKKVKEIREEELQYLRGDAIYVALNTFLTQGSAILVTFVTFVIFTYHEQRTLNASIVFTSIALFNQITVPLYIIPAVLSMLLSAWHSNKRLMAFLSTPEIRNDSIEWRETLRSKSLSLVEPNSAPIVSEPRHALPVHKSLDRSHSAATPDFLKSSHHQCSFNELTCFLQDAKFAWYDEDISRQIREGAEVEVDNCTLSDLTVQIPRGKLTILVGSIGGGKSALLYSLIGELQMLAGRLGWLNENRTGFGYVPSNPWILNVSLQENIIFGRPFDSKRYDEVVHRCCLQADIDLLPFGDQTLIGERGVTLSGGQRQRIALARALYSNTATLILDDAFSALDPIVGYSVFESAISRWAIKQQGRTVILATHKHDLLARADYVIVLDSGSIKNAGSLQQIQKEDKGFFYHCNVIKEKELCQHREKQDSHSTLRERQKLVRIVSKKEEYRGSSMKNKVERRVSARKPKSFARQLSCETTSALPCHEWIDTFDRIEECELESVLSPALRTVNSSHQLFGMSDSEQSKHSHLSLSSSTASSDTQRTVSRAVTFSRLNSRMSNYSNQATSIVEEDEGGALDTVAASNEVGADDSDDSPIEDDTNEETNEMLSEVNFFKKNQTSSDSTSIYHEFASTSALHHKQISWQVYRTYIKAHSYKLAAAVFFAILFNQMLKVVSDFWLTQWTSDDEHRHRESSLSNQEDLLYYILVYAALSLVSVIVSVSQLIFAQLVAIRAVRVLHENLLDRLVQASLLFFDKTPIGRILNRFTNDINVIDRKLPIAIPVLLRFLFLCLSAILINIYITPYFTLVILPIVWVYYYLQKRFRCTSLQLQRLELSSKAPIISHFNQTIDGLTTIRAFREEDKFKNQFFQLLDINNLCFLLFNSSNCSLGITLDYLGGLILFLAIFTSITAALYWNVSSAFVGFALTYTLLVPVYLNWLVRNFSTVEMNMSSVERILQYSSVKSELSCFNKLQKDDNEDDWPVRGEIKFQDVTIRYETCFQPIIWNASFTIQPGEKIGICGRTGSGKSSLIGAIFKINQVCSGSISIDGVDIKTMCPHKIRKRLSIIPQEAVLFNGTIRENLDPLEQSTDTEIWSVLKDFRLAKKIGDLSEDIGDDSRFSSGERQLFCCARAFLRRSPILIMDESCANLDQRTERLVVNAISQSPRTIILIAHNVKNLIDFNRIMVVDKGRIVEFDTPDRLKNNSQSMFYALYHRKYRS